MKKTARLIVTLACHRDCPLCVNWHPSIAGKMWDLTALHQLDEYEEIVITGGEPMLEPEKTLRIIQRLRAIDSCRTVYLYTALWGRTEVFDSVLNAVDGITYTLHAPLLMEDEHLFSWLQETMRHRRDDLRSHRLRIEAGIDKGVIVVPNVWSSVETFRLLPDGECELPENEDLFVWQGREAWD